VARRLDEAEQLIVPAIATVKAAWGAKARRTLLAQSVLANIRSLQGRFAESADLYTGVHEGMAALYGETNQAAISFLEGAAIATRSAGDPKKAQGMLRSALASARVILKEDNPQVEHLRYRLAASLLDLHESTDEAAQLIDKLDASTLNLAEQERDWVDRLAYQRARLMLARGHGREAYPLLQRAQTVARAQSPADPDLPVPAIAAAIAAIHGAGTSGD
jgi:hypothetical protein